MKTLIAITGPDGAGKDTLIGSLVQSFSETTKARLRVVSIWDAMTDPEFRKEFPIEPHKIDSYLAMLSSPARALFLAHAMRQSLDLALKDKTHDILLLNGYWMKYFACEGVYGAETDFLLNLSKLFPEPKITLYLDVPVEMTLARKSKLSGYETGFAELNDRRKAFIPFQTEAQARFQFLKNKFNWTRIDASQSAETVLKETKEKLYGILS